MFALHRLLRSALSALPLWIASAGAWAQAGTPVLNAYTEEWPPYNYSERGELKGVATDILRALCAEAELRCLIDSVPWARAYAAALKSPNAMVYTTVRRPSREHDFIWIGPILSRSTWVWGRAGGTATIRDRKDLPLLRYGVVRGEAAAQDLLDAGVPPAALVADASNAAILRQLRLGWIDAMVDTELGMAWNLRQAGMASSEVLRLAPLSEQGGYYFAMNRHSDPALVERLQSALERLRSKGTIEELMRAYAVERRP
ncbi:transporter substrate-binding domain-containing protein [Roseateles cavernae]|uniref:transporter substrate-binding domain-containing protein n=1 Tax=Roseateles cavernae TaxID=3153578 RepID=UPI0032E41802